MTAARRWCLVALGVLLLIATPVAIHALPATDSDVTSGSLLRQIRASKSVPYSGYVESAGTLKLSVTNQFSALAGLLGSTTRMRVWWIGADRWRVDTLRSAGETDLFRDADGTTKWSYESGRASRSPHATVRLPDASDLLPPTLAARSLTGARANEVNRIDSQRIAGRDAPGLRLTPSDPASRIDHVDVWADPDTGIPLRTEIYANGDRQPSIRTSFRSLTTTPPALDTTLFFPPPGVNVRSDDVVDIAAAVERFSSARSPRQLAGLETHTGAPPGAVGLYGRGVTALMSIPLRGQEARPLREQLAKGAVAKVGTDGMRLGAGPLGVLLTPPDRDGRDSVSWLLVGTVTDATLAVAARELIAGSGTSR